MEEGIWSEATCLKAPAAIMMMVGVVVIWVPANTIEERQLRVLTLLVHELAHQY